jgi:hypothetical protein
MRNFLKTQLKFGLAEYFKQHLGKLKYAHAFQHILTVKAPSSPHLNKEEKAYLRSAIWSEYSMEAPSAQAGRA